MYGNEDQSRAHLTDVLQQTLEPDTKNLAILLCRMLEPVRREDRPSTVKVKRESERLLGSINLMEEKKLTLSLHW